MVATPSWADLYRELPPAFDPYQLDLAWDRRRLWALDVPVEPVPVAELEWQLDLPWWRDGDRFFAVSPLEVARDPARYAEQAERVRRADLAFPISITMRSGRWFVLDGVHRLLKATQAEHPTIRARKIPEAMVRQLAASGRRG